MTEFLNDLERFWSTNNEWLWITLGVVIAIIAVAALVGWLMATKRGMDRKHAAAIRADAERQGNRIGVEDAETRRLEAEAEQARAEADRLEVLANERRASVERQREQQARRLHEADRLDHGRYQGARR